MGELQLRKRGTIRDLFTGEIIQEDVDFTEGWLQAMWRLKKSKQQFYMVTGPARHKGHREMIDKVIAMDVTVITDVRCRPDCAVILQGDPSEWKEVQIGGSEG